MRVCNFRLHALRIFDRIIVEYYNLVLNNLYYTEDFFKSFKYFSSNFKCLQVMHLENYFFNHREICNYG